MTKGFGIDNDQEMLFFFDGGGGGKMMPNIFSSKNIYHKKTFSAKWFQNGFKIVIDLFGEMVWKESLHLK